MNKIKLITIMVLVFAVAFARGFTHGRVFAAGVPHYFGPYPNWANSPMPKGPITSVEVISGGIGYESPTVEISDVYGTGSGAIAAVTVAGGVITEIVVTNGGSGYTAPVITITDAAGEGVEAAAIIGGVPGSLSGGIRKFVDSLPGLGSAGANNLGQYISVANPDTATYPGSDYYEIGLVEYSEQMHSDLPVTKLRGYVQLNNGTDVSGENTIAPAPVHYLGPLIVSGKDRPVRIKFTNMLPTGADGNLFLPVDESVMGAGMGPMDMEGMPGMKENYKQNRATIHLHGNNSVWISDGTPHQWITPAGEMTAYPKGVSVVNVPDMPDPGDGSQTFYYTNQQSARLMFYHDHAFGITRLNVYAGEAAAYLITDQVEQDLINGTNNSGVNPELLHIFPDVGIPLVIQDKTFVDSTTISFQDPTWEWGSSMSTTAVTGDLWYPHVYVPAQNPGDISGVNPFGRWHYGPWFWPPTKDIINGPVANPYYDPINAPWEPPLNPGTPNPSMPGEAFMDIPAVNGTVYPYIEIEPKTYRFRILNACNDRFVNLQLYVADSAVVTADGRVNTEVKMVPAVRTAGFPSSWPTDGRDGGVPDANTRGPSFIQIGTEGGFLPAPVVVPNQPVTWNNIPTTFNFGNVENHALLLGTAERVDVIIDFSMFAGKTLILYNDAPAAFPALDPRYDYYTGNPDLTAEGGAPTTQPGYGPNTRTIMQIRVAASAPAPAYSLANLKSVFAKTGTKRGVFEVSQDEIIVPDARYNSAYDTTFPVDTYVRIQDNFLTFKTVSGSIVTLPLEPKAMQDEMGEAYDMDYGRMSGMLGVEMPMTQAGVQNFILYGYASPPVEIVKGTTYGTPIGVLEDGTQIWKITHNGVDTHTIHTHLFNAQLINRVGWDGAIRPPDANELGWKETFRVSPLEDTIIAFRPILPSNIPFSVPNSVRLIDPTMPEGELLKTVPGGFVTPTGEPVIVTNHYVNFGWEYVWHCHILAHEEMDMMHSLVFAVAPETPSNLTANGFVGSLGVNLAWKDMSMNETGFTIHRATDPGFTTELTIFTAGENDTAYTDNTVLPLTTYFYRVFASNTVGDTTDYSDPNINEGASFPNKTLNSGFSNIARVGTPEITTASPLPLGVKNVFYSQAINAMGGYSPYTWARTAGSLPAGVTLSASGVISGTPTNTGTFNFTVRVTDGLGSIATKAFSLRIVNQLLITTTSPRPDGTVGIFYSGAFVATGGVSPYSWSLAGGSIPNGLRLSGAGILNGIPRVPGIFNFTVQVTDSVGTISTKAFAMTVNVNPLIITTTSPRPDGTVGTLYSRNFTATGGVSPYSWSLTGGSIPNGLTLSSTGNISGTPTMSGTFNFTVQVKDNLGTTATKDFSITIVVAPLVISTATPMPAGTLGTFYVRVLGAAGGVKPYIWSLIGGSLPNGLRLSTAGLISGTPAVRGTFSFTVQVRDSLGTITSKGLSITIN